MQDEQLAWLQCQAGKGAAVVVRELDLENVRSQFLDNGSDLATKRETQLTHFTHEAVRDFAISPDGRWIVYERGQEIYNPWDKTRPALWLIGTDGRSEHLLVESGEMPAWGR